MDEREMHFYAMKYAVGLLAVFLFSIVSIIIGHVSFLIGFQDPFIIPALGVIFSLPFILWINTAADIAGVQYILWINNDIIDSLKKSFKETNLIKKRMFTPFYMYFYRTFAMIIFFVNSKKRFNLKEMYRSMFIDGLMIPYTYSSENILKIREKFRRILDEKTYIHFMRLNAQLTYVRYVPLYLLSFFISAGFVFALWYLQGNILLSLPRLILFELSPFLQIILLFYMMMTATFLIAQKSFGDTILAREQINKQQTGDNIESEKYNDSY